MLTLHKPAYEDLWFRQKMLGDEETMSYNHAWGGTIPFPEENWADWYDYWITNPDGKRYYGSSINPESRWKHGEGYNTQPVGKAIKEFGWENVEKRIIAENLTKTDASLIERTLIKTMHTDMPNFGYNKY